MSIYNSSFGILRICNVLKEARASGRKIHLIGVLGAGQRGIAELLLARGFKVSGSDRQSAKNARELIDAGLEFYPVHDGKNIDGAALVAYTLAISSDNPEYRLAKEMKIPTVSRAELAAAIASESDRLITVAGAHGKSTVTAMLDCVFTAAGKSPTTLSGALLPSGGFSHKGGGDFFIAEACEYKDSFLRFRPSVAIVNNIELDHTDYFKSEAALLRSFSRYLGRASDFALIPSDDALCASLNIADGVRTVSFGAGLDADYRYSLLSLGGKKNIFSVFSKKHGELGEFELNIPGVFNISNATAVISASIECGLDLERVRDGIASYSGIKRRLEYIGNYRTRDVFYDYAHHPTEIYSVICALRTMGHETVTVLFKSHTYSRTASFFSDFARSLSLADYVVIGDIFAAREENSFGVTPQKLVNAIGENAFYATDETVTETLDNLTRGTIIVMGAADMTEVLNKMNMKV